MFEIKKKRAYSCSYRVNEWTLGETGIKTNKCNREYLTDKVKYYNRITHMGWYFSDLYR